MTAVLDASAVLTLLFREPGHETVADLLEGSVISAVNWSEVVQKLAQRGVPEPAAVTAGLLGLGATVVPFDRRDAEAAAHLSPAGRARGLSLGDRACLAVAQALPHAVAVTADVAWADIDAGVEVLVVRGRTPTPAERTVADYLDALPPDRRGVIASVRQVLAEAMPAGYQEAVDFGMITWSVPLERYPTTYNGRPLQYVTLTAQKRHYSLYLMALYAGSEQEVTLRSRWEAGGRTLDMGKSCLRFRALADLDLDVVREVVASTPVEDYLARYERARTP